MPRFGVPYRVFEGGFGLNPSAAELCQTGVRESFSKLFRNNYTVTWFERRHDSGVYLLEPPLS